MDPQVFLHGNDVLVSVLVSLSDSQILSLFLNYFFLSSLSLFLLSFTFRDHALSWHGEEKSNWNRCYTPVTIISHVCGSGPIRQIDERFCVSGKRISHFLDRISEHSKEFSFSFSLYTFLYRLEKILFPIVFNFPGLYNQAARLSCAFCDICCILEEDRNIGIAFCSMFFPRGLPGNRYSN